MERKNGNIELVRFLAAVSIAIYHFEWLYVKAPVYFIHFYIFVEFFFVLSGFFLGLNVSRDREKDLPTSFGYVRMRITKMYPLYFFAFLVAFVVNNICGQIPMSQWVARLWDAKWELLLLDMAGISNSSHIYVVGGAPEYISALLICSLILHGILRKYKDIFVDIIAPLLILAGSGRIINLFGDLSVWYQWDNLFSAGIVRGMVDMSAGLLFAFVAVPIYEKKKKNGLVARVCLSLALIVFLVFGRNVLAYNDLVLYIYVFGMLIAALYVIEGLKTVQTIFIFLGKMAYVIFLFHGSILVFLDRYFPGLSYKRAMIIFLVLIFTVAVLVQFLYEKLARRMMAGIINKRSGREGDDRGIKEIKG